jgi:transcriptional regulator of acetoin/glycerol metabolism
MTPDRLSPQDHAHRILSVVQQGRHDVATSDVVANSWARCLNVYGLDPTQQRRPPVLARLEFDARRARMADVIDCARYEMSTLYQQLGDPESAVVLTDAQGVILHMQASPDFERRVQPLGLELGAVWSEAEAGTNGMGTCAVAARPIAVCQEDHFLAQYAQLTCSAVPVHDPSGEMCAVLDVSSRSSMPQQHLLLLLGMTARMIENRLMDMRYPEAHPIHFHSRPEFVYTLHEGKLIVDDDGRVLSANRSALFQLGLQTVGEIRTRRLEQIFQTTLPHMLERSHHASFHPVVTYRTDAAHRFFAVAREPARRIEAPQPGQLPGQQAAAMQGRRVVMPANRAPTVVAAHRPAAAAANLPATPPVARATFGDARLQAHLATGTRVIARGTPLLLRGETGAGKEVLARAVHAASPRAEGPFVAVNCASLPEHLIEAELFGYRAGAFTGAERSGRRGRIAQADGGTLFLDEIGDMPLVLQARLLRVLDERMVTPLGTDDSRPVDFQLISASHRQLDRLVAEGSFREDLYFRLAGIELVLPPLRDREDRAQVIRDVLADEGAADIEVSPEAWDLLMTHPWPGNVRQLRHVIRSAAALAVEGTLLPQHLPTLASAGPGPSAARGVLTPAGMVGGAAAQLPAPADDGPALPPADALARRELMELLESVRWNVSHAAKALAVSRNTLYRRMHKLQIPVTHAE